MFVLKKGQTKEIPLKISNTFIKTTPKQYQEYAAARHLSTF